MTRYRFTGSSMTPITSSPRSLFQDQEREAEPFSCRLRRTGENGRWQGCDQRGRTWEGRYVDGDLIIRHLAGSDEATGDQDPDNPLPARELELDYPARWEAMEQAAQGPRSPELPPDLERMLGDRERLRRIGDAALSDLGRPRDGCEDIQAIAALQRKLNQHYSGRRYD